MPSRATTWIDCATNAPGQMRSMTPAIGVLRCWSPPPLRLIERGPADEAGVGLVGVPETQDRRLVERAAHDLER